MTRFHPKNESNSRNLKKRKHRQTAKKTGVLFQGLLSVSSRLESESARQSKFKGRKAELRGR